MTRTLLLVSWSLAILGCAGASPASRTDAAGPPPVEIRLQATPASTVREDQLDAFQVDFVVRNLKGTTVDPGLDRSVLRVDGVPWLDWPVTIGNGPRDARWSALPPGDALQFGYALRGALFRGPGRYSIVLETAGAASSPLVVQVTPR